MNSMMFFVAPEKQIKSLWLIKHKEFWKNVYSSDYKYYFVFKFILIYFAVWYEQYWDGWNAGNMAVLILW